MSRHVLISVLHQTKNGVLLLKYSDRSDRRLRAYSGRMLTFSRCKVSNTVFDWCAETGFIPKYRSYRAAVRLSFKDEVEASLFRMAFDINGRS